MFKRLSNFKELDAELETCFRITDDLDEADIVVTDNTEFIKENKLNIIISENVPENHVSINPNTPTAYMLEDIKLVIKTYSISPRIDRISFLQEQNALLSEANKGLVELYNLIDNKNHQIEFLKTKLENIINSAGESIVELNEDLLITYANQKFADTTGYDRQGAVGKDFISLIHAQDTDSFKDTLNLVATEKTANLQMRLRAENGAYITVNAYATMVTNSIPHYEIIFEDISKKLLIEQHMKKLEEKAIVAGFSRHLSHNILNALTVAAGFLRKIRSESDVNEQQAQKWSVVEHKCRLIEEIVTGYNDYTNAISMRLDENFDVAGFLRSVIEEVRDKTFSKNFSAFLYNFLDQYTMTTEFKDNKEFSMQGSRMFLKMAVCYIIKDSIRFFDEYVPLRFKITTEELKDKLIIEIRLHDVDVDTAIINTMLQPWNHQVLSQSFDYWGIVISNVIVEKHGGAMHLRKDSAGLSFIIEF
ncbi:PAS domain-containing protein [Seleniivibrio woodruffii]|uniref:PAS domain-containing protein n=1 Tax=Seleniivibrio woodruffii TaxID=1078050 RepID=UPI0026EA9F9E|nr:PAS domain-containing protein [Seleniivibrio woodruffii]